MRDIEYFKHIVVRLIEDLPKMSNGEQQEALEDELRGAYQHGVNDAMHAIRTMNRETPT